MSAISGIRYRYILPLAIALAGVVIVPRANAGEYTKSYSLAGRANVRISTDDGTVRIITTDAKQVDFRVKYNASPWRLGFGSDPHVDSDQKGDVVELNARAGWHVGVGIGAEQMTIEVHMPKDGDLQLETVDGRVEIASLNGRVVAHSVDGGIQISHVTGTVDIHSTDGAINATALKGDLKLETSDGSITASDLDGRCTAHTSDGALHIAGRFDSLDLRSEDGVVTARVESGSAISSTWRIRSADGAVRLALPGDFKANLDATTNNGRITVNLPAAANGNASKSEFHGTLNGGGPVVLVHTGNGAIDLSRL
jgi:hypothetical protein